MTNAEQDTKIAALESRVAELAKAIDGFDVRYAPADLTAAVSRLGSDFSNLPNFSLLRSELDSVMSTTRAHTDSIARIEADLAGLIDQGATVSTGSVAGDLTIAWAEIVLNKYYTIDKPQVVEPAPLVITQ